MSTARRLPLLLRVAAVAVPPERLFVFPDELVPTPDAAVNPLGDEQVEQQRQDDQNDKAQPEK